MTSTSSSAVDGSPGSPLLAALDLLTERERHADQLAVAAAAVLSGSGAQRLTVGTHAVTLGQRRHVALVLEVSGLGTGTLTRLLAGLVDRDQHWEVGLLAGSDYAGPEALRDGLQRAVQAQRSRSSGRAVVFPGSARLSGTTTVGAVLAGTDIDRVRMLGGAEPDSATALVTRDFVRPRWVGGELVLHAQPAAGGVVVPFESPDPTPCCAAHS